MAHGYFIKDRSRNLMSFFNLHRLSNSLNSETHATGPIINVLAHSQSFVCEGIAGRSDIVWSNVLSPLLTVAEMVAPAWMHSPC